MQALVTRHLDAIRSDINNGYKPGVTLTQTVWYHRCVQEQADHFLTGCVTYFGDMVSFFDEIATDLLKQLTPLLNIPDGVMARLYNNTNAAEFHTTTPHGVVVGSRPEKGVGQGRANSTSLSMLPLELIAEMIAVTVPGQLHWGRDGNLTATPMAMACDDASGTRTGPHAEHHTEALAAANFIAGPIVTGLEHGYK